MVQPIQVCASPCRLEVSLRHLILAIAFIALPLAGGAAANSVISCHCFQERAYDPARPQIADPYLLATTQNTFMAIIFDLAKRDLVQAKMGGTSGDHLWVAHYLASEHGVPSAPLLTARQRSGTWRGALHAIDFGTLRSGERFAALLHNEAADQSLAAAAADEMLVERFGAQASELERLRFRGADTAQVILCSLLARKSGRSIFDIHDDFSSGRSSWGQLFDAAGLQPGALLEREIRGFMR
jgi:hypothetical protein